MKLNDPKVLKHSQLMKSSVSVTRRVAWLNGFRWPKGCWRPTQVAMETGLSIKQSLSSTLTNNRKTDKGSERNQV